MFFEFPKNHLSSNDTLHLWIEAVFAHVDGPRYNALRHDALRGLGSCGFGKVFRSLAYGFNCGPIPVDDFARRKIASQRYSLIS